jgi:hypothetical protein
MAESIMSLLVKSRGFHLKDSYSVSRASAARPGTQCSICCLEQLARVPFDSISKVLERCSPVGVGRRLSWIPKCTSPSRQGRLLQEMGGEMLQLPKLLKGLCRESGLDSSTIDKADVPQRPNGGNGGGCPVVVFGIGEACYVED